MWGAFLWRRITCLQGSPSKRSDPGEGPFSRPPPWLIPSRVSVPGNHSASTAPVCGGGEPLDMPPITAIVGYGQAHRGNAYLRAPGPGTSRNGSQLRLRNQTTCNPWRIAGPFFLSGRRRSGKLFPMSEGGVNRYVSRRGSLWGLYPDCPRKGSPVDCLRLIPPWCFFAWFRTVFFRPNWSPSSNSKPSA